MAETTKIEWCDSTANLWEGCTQVSPGCGDATGGGCYAMVRNARFNNGEAVNWGPHAPRKFVKAGWALIAKYQRAAAKNGGVDPDLGRKRRIFVNSLSDVFDNHRSILWRDDAFALFEASADVILILVTKRPENVAKMVPAHWMQPGGWPAHVWLLVTTEDQERWDHRVPILKSIPAPVRGVSIEPMLGRIDVYEHFYEPCPSSMDGLQMDPTTGMYECCARCNFTGIGEEPWLDWVIVGGESGPGARPMHPDWARSLRDQCGGAGTAFLHKQNGEFAPGEIAGEYLDPEKPARGFTWWNGQWQECWSEPDGHCDDEPDVYRVGKTRAGRLLDGVTHEGFPQ